MDLIRVNLQRQRHALGRNRLASGKQDCRQRPLQFIVFHTRLLPSGLRFIRHFEKCDGCAVRFGVNRHRL